MDSYKNFFSHKQSRLQTMAANRLGWIYQGSSKGSNLTKEVLHFLYRKPELEVLIDYFKNVQYSHLTEYQSDISSQQQDERKNQPKKIFPFPQIVAEKLSSYLTATTCKLNFELQNKQKDQEILNDMIKDSMLWGILSYAFEYLIVCGSTFVKCFSTKNGKLMLKVFKTSSCFPVFDDGNDLVEITIRYVYDSQKFDQDGKKIYKWAQQKLTKTEDIIYDNPIFKRDIIPKFKAIDKVTHNLGFVPRCLVL